VAETCPLIPETGDTLQQLLRIPPIANLVNAFLDQATFPGLQVRASGAPDPTVRQRESILSNLRHFEEVCVLCEERLGEALGPLT